MSRGRIPVEVRERVRHAAVDRCGYCLSRQELVLGRLQLEHIIPSAKGGTDDEENLWLACSLCNSYKGVQTTGLDPLTSVVVSLFNPRQQTWSDHFRWSEDEAQIDGLTPCGRATVIALQLNNVLAVTVRRGWVQAGWHPPR